jgi:hypothetical protein
MAGSIASHSSVGESAMSLKPRPVNSSDVSYEDLSAAGVVLLALNDPPNGTITSQLHNSHIIDPGEVSDSDDEPVEVIFSEALDEPMG